MSKFVIIFVFCVYLLDIFTIGSANNKIHLRTRRQIEREGNLNETVTVVAGEREPNTEYEVVRPKDEGKTDVLEVDFDQDDGTFQFGGRFPAFFDNKFHSHFDQLFRQMTKRFEDMARGMFDKFNTTSSQYPNNYNGTKEEIVTIAGKQYTKKEHIIKKSSEGINVFITTTTYEPIDEPIDSPNDKPNDGSVVEDNNEDNETV